MKLHSLRPEFVEFIPKNLEGGLLYISKRFSTASHLCACGCGTRIVTPLHETEYQLKEQSGRVSLHPSIGNWNHPCQAHYWIFENRVVWAKPMSAEAIRQGREYDDAARDAYFASVARPWWRRLAGKIRFWLESIFG